MGQIGAQPQEKVGDIMGPQLALHEERDGEKVGYRQCGRREGGSWDAVQGWVGIGVRLRFGEWKRESKWGGVGVGL